VLNYTRRLRPGAAQTMKGLLSSITASLRQAKWLPVFILAAFLTAFFLSFAVDYYFVSTRPGVADPTTGRVYVLNVKGRVAYLTRWEHLLDELSFWVAFGMAVLALVLRINFQVGARRM
jgi:hypothetical protein